MSVSRASSLELPSSGVAVGCPPSPSLPPVTWRFPSHMFESFVHPRRDELAGNATQQQLLRQHQFQQKQLRLQQQHAWNKQYRQDLQKQEIHPDLEQQVQHYQRRHGEFYLKHKLLKHQDAQRKVQQNINEQVQRYQKQQQELQQELQKHFENQSQMKDGGHRQDDADECGIDYQERLRSVVCPELLPSKGTKEAADDGTEVFQLVRAQPFASYEEYLRSVEIEVPSCCDTEVSNDPYRSDASALTVLPVTTQLQDGPIMLQIAGVTTDSSSDDSLLSLRRNRQDLSMDSGIQGSSCDLADSSDPEEIQEDASKSDRIRGAIASDFKAVSASTILDGETYNLVEEVYVEEDPKSRFQKEAIRASMKKPPKRPTKVTEISIAGDATKMHAYSETNSVVNTLPKTRPTPIPAKRSLSSASQCRVAPPRLFIKNNCRRPSSVSANKYMSLDSLNAAASIVEEQRGLPFNATSLDSVHQTPFTSAIDDLIDQAFETDEDRDGVQDMMCDSLEDVAEVAVKNGPTTKSGVQQAKPKVADNRFVVVAIDFGTTYTGYAFTFVRDPDVTIHMMRKWEGGDPGINNQKIPTTLLLTPTGEFHSFGFAARDFFHDLEPQEAKKWLYFDKFKMVLHQEQNVSRGCLLSAANGKQVSAVGVFGKALRHLKELVLTELSDQAGGEVKADDVRWVVTVPAIWKQPAKQLMREAAYQAGIADAAHPEGLLIALEPECASLCCRKLRMNQLVPERAMEKDNASTWSSTASLPAMEPAPSELLLHDTKEGMRYMVVDCGGGTVDITVHELRRAGGSSVQGAAEDSTLRELHKATGGPWGSVRVDQEFIALLGDTFGDEFVEQFRLKRPAAFVELMLSFEARKRSASPFRDAPLNVFPPFAFIDYYRKYSGKEVEQAVRKLGRKEVTWSSQGMLRLQPSVMRELFGPTVNKIVEHIAAVLDAPTVGRVEYLFLVGGFAESQILQHEVRSAFKDRVKVIIPQGVSLAILRGAVLFGLNPTLITTRRSKQTYGVGVMKRFDADLHPREKLVVRDGQEWCADVLDKFVSSEQAVELGESVIRRYTPTLPSQGRIVINIYAAAADDACFITDPGVTRCGVLTLHLALVEPREGEDGKRREIHTRMVFGGTEISASALDVASGQFVQMDVDFLTL